MDNNLDTTGGVVPPTVIVDPVIVPVDPPVFVYADPVPLTALQPSKPDGQNSRLVCQGQI